MGAITLYLWTQNALLDSAPMWVRWSWYDKLIERRWMIKIGYR